MIIAPTKLRTGASEVLSASLHNDERLHDEMESTLNKGEAIQYVLNNLPTEMTLLRNLEAVIESSLGIASNLFRIGRFLLRGGIVLWLSKEDSLNRHAIQITEGAFSSKVRNLPEEAKKRVLFYRVPLWFDLDNFTDVLGEDMGWVLIAASLKKKA